MEENLLAIAYLEEKEKALEHRKIIDLDLKPALKELEDDKSEAGKLKVPELEKQIADEEERFKKTIERMQAAFTPFYPYLERIGASKTNPYLLHYHQKDYGFYIDDNKNIHYTTY
ncbi:hypothetical protein OC25_02035 [Pedobacter kyungheensis]|uniref:Uncharacterized protein n=1 Tax=Pedobacter kyungheensis TaxID=1069985 RepID=A0A0C1FXF9_9SPHI|nr:hypothetical protein [Pedobacter kyungheensis]KIA96548.1 hypothetical protein OC25_02035 [Pedobacter kyungheensis]